MERQFRIFTQEHRDGSVTALALAVPGLSAYGATRAAAIGELKDKLAAYLGDLDRGAWGRFILPEQQELRTLEIELAPHGKLRQPPIPITISLVVTTEQHKRGSRQIITAPRIPGFRIVVTDAEQIDMQAREALAQYTDEWEVLEIVEADQTGPESLEVIAITLPDGGAEAETAEPLGNTSNQENVLGLCGLNLTEQAAQGRLGHADRREALVEQMIAALAGERRNSVILVGRSDVGKTAILHEVVHRISKGNVPPALRGREVWFVTANNLIAGMKYTGEWQGRTQKLIAQVRRGRQILYMADPNEILDAGRWSGSDNNMGRFLRPYIENGELTIVCECAPEGFEAGMRVEPSFMNAFRRIDVIETDEADTLAIIHAAARRLEAARNVSIDPGATTAALDLTRRFMPYRAFPGKAVRFLEELVRDTLLAQSNGGRAVQLNGPTAGQLNAPTSTLDRAAALAGFARKTGLPAFILSDEMPMRVPEVRAYFEERLLGQPDAVGAMVDLITVIKAGLNDPNKPLGSFFFVGPTGVGKTESAKVLAEFLFGSRDRMQRFDMSEYAAADALPRLIGTAWKPDSEGELTRRVREQPFCVVLLDELEKAHREVFDALLGVLGEGRLTDASGRTADFRNTIIIMTSNLGASRREMQEIGLRPTGGRGVQLNAPTEPADGDGDDRMRDHFVKEAERFFRPEFINRIDRIVAFRPLTVPAMGLIARRELGKLLMREGIVRRNLLVEIDDAVIENLVARGFHPLYGARPLQREIERMVNLPLARLLVDQGAGHGHLLHFEVRDGRIELGLVPLDVDEEAAETAPAPPAPDRRLETDITAVLRAIRELHERTGAEEATPVVQRLRREVAGLLARTREPGFWDNPAAAREVLSRVYHLERVLKRLDALVERAGYLEEKGRQIRAHRDRRGVPDLARDVEQLGAEFAYVQMELAGVGAGAGHDRALVRVTPLGRESEEWAGQVLAMYAAWAARKGYEYDLLTLSQPSDSRGRGSPAPAAPTGLYIQGSNVYEFLRGEAGLHKLNTGAAEERQRTLARVSVLHVPESLPEDDPEQLHAALARLTADTTERREEGTAVVRSYSQGRHRFVRDRRTGVRLSDVAAVLREGQIDAFLLASLRQAITEPHGEGRSA